MPEQEMWAGMKLREKKKAVLGYTSMEQVETIPRVQLDTASTSFLEVSGHRLMSLSEDMAMPE